jgi:hypothetical protein
VHWPRQDGTSVFAIVDATLRNNSLTPTQAAMPTLDQFKAFLMDPRLVLPWLADATQNPAAGPSDVSPRGQRRPSHKRQRANAESTPGSGPAEAAVQNPRTLVSDSSTPQTIYR